MQKRFRLAHSNQEFTCYDCRTIVGSGEQMCWDNKRNVRICVPCFDKLSEIVATPDGLESGATKKKVYWDESMLPTMPWHIGNYDVNNWPVHVQKKYARLSKSEEAYKAGLKAARNRLGTGTAHCSECEAEAEQKRPWDDKCGSVEDWIAQIQAQTDKDACIALWGVINTVAWSRESQMQLGKAYVKHLANLVSIDTWGKPLSVAVLQKNFQALGLT